MIVVNRRYFEVVVKPDVDGFKAYYSERLSDKFSAEAEIHVGIDADAVKREAEDMVADKVLSGKI